jgi:voltage-gated potassium channel
MYRDRFVWALVLFVTSISIGILGYMHIEDFSFVNALYMTIITISTVGFTEVGELSAEGRVFTSAYILFNLGVYGYSIAIITHYLIEGELKRKFHFIHVEKKIRKMNNHVIVCGFGRNGSKAAEELLRNKIQVVIIESKASNAFHKDPVYKDAVFLEGDATTDELLLHAGIQKAKAIITSLPSDADNVFITLTARELNPEMTIIARASDPLSETKLKRAGANNVVMPDFIGGLHMAGLLLRYENPALFKAPQKPNIQGYNVEEVPLSRLGERFAGMRLTEINMVLEGSMVVGYKHKAGNIIINPGADVTFSHDDTLLLVYSSQ